MLMASGLVQAADWGRTWRSFDNLSGTWQASNGYPGLMRFDKKMVRVQPKGLPEINGSYKVSGQWLEIVPIDGRRASTMKLACLKQDECTLTYDNGESQTFTRIE